MERLKILYQFLGDELHLMSGTLRNLEETLDFSLDIVYRVFNPSACSIMLFNENGELQARAGRGSKKDEEALVSLRLGEGVAGWVAKERKSAVVEDVRQDERFARFSLFHDVVSLICIPLEVRDKCVGVLNVSTDYKRKFISEEEKLLYLLGNRIALAIENHELFTKLQEKQKELETLFQNIPDAVFSLNVRGEIVNLNRATEILTGISMEDAAGKPFKDICDLPHVPVFPLRRDIWKKRRLLHGSAILKNQMGENIPVTVHWASLLDHEENVSGAVCVIRDLRPRQELETLKRDFLSTVSHDLRTPLTALKGYVSLLNSKRLGQLTHTQKECLDAIKRNTTKLNNLIEELLSFSKLESQAEAVMRSRFSIRKLIFQLQRDFESSFKKKSLSFSCNGMPSESICADKAKLWHILNNLVSNAVKFTPLGGEILLSAIIQGNSLQVEVKDNGEGISPKELPHIFAPFYQSAKMKKSSPKEGFGLGLAIAKKLVEIQGGHIRAHSVVGDGTSIYFEIPNVLGLGGH